MANQTGAPIEGAVTVAMHLEALHAIENPELFGKGDWELRLWINGIERWRSSTLHVGDGEFVSIADTVVTEVAPFTDVLELEVQATEKDPLNPDEHASGKGALYRSHGFLPVVDGLLVDLQGENAHIQLRGRVDVTLT